MCPVVNQMQDVSNTKDHQFISIAKNFFRENNCCKVGTVQRDERGIIRYISLKKEWTVGISFFY